MSSMCRYALRKLRTTRCYAASEAQQADGWAGGCGAAHLVDGGRPVLTHHVRRVLVDPIALERTGGQQGGAVLVVLGLGRDLVLEGHGDDELEHVDG